MSRRLLPSWNSCARSLAFKARGMHPEWLAAQKRWRLAFAYATGRLTVVQAQEIVCQCEPVAGWHPLTTLAVDDVLEDALERYRDHPALADYIARGCARVAHRYDNSGEELSFARNWAIEEAVTYAADDDVHFQRRDADGEDSR